MNNPTEIQIHYIILNTLPVCHNLALQVFTLRAMTTYYFKNPEDVGYLHMATKKYGKEQRQYFRRGRSGDPTRLPNIIFDITAKEKEDFDDIMRYVKEEYGYEIH